MGHEVEITAHN